MDSGHKENFRDMIISRVVAKYRNSLAKHECGIKPLYRTKVEREKVRQEAGGRAGKADWFRKTGASAVLTVPATEGGRLAEKVKEALAAAPNPSGCKTLVREQPGPSVKQALVRSNPKPRETCGRNLCPYARTGDKCRQRCYKDSISYMGRCLRCADQQRQEGKQEEHIVWETYQGETSRSIVSRAREHYDDYKTAMKKPPTTRQGT